MSNRHLLIAGGGTGGHIAPALAIGERASRHFTVSYACTPRPVDALMYSDLTEAVHVLNPPRVDKGMKLLLPFTAAKSFFKARALIRSTKADVVLGTGGYSSFFSILAARSLSVPATIFDSNAIPGRSNRLASKFCRVAFTSFPGGEKGLNCPSLCTGTPVSVKMRQIPVSAARKLLGIDEDRSVLLFLGGSQGAKAINDLALAVEGDVSILLQCGSRDHKRILEKLDGRKNIEVKPFVRDLALWYAAADLAVARAGGQTIAELSAFGLPSVLIPYPFAAEDHQMANAIAVETAGGALCKSQKEAESGDLNHFLIQLLENSKELDSMSAAIRKIFPENPAENIVSHLLELLQ